MDYDATPTFIGIKKMFSVSIVLAVESAIQNEDPLASSPITTQERRRIQTLDISPIHRVPNRKKRKLSDIEEETASDVQFSDTQARCEECRLDGK